MPLLPPDFWPKALYIHVPFCASHCPYCDFFVHVPQSRGDDTEYMPFVQRCIAQLDSYLAERPDLLYRLESIYLGGGTPSLLSPRPLEYLLEALHSRCSQASRLCELTMESNPEMILPESLALWQSLGITRLSVGLQSQSNPLLKLLGRRSSVAMHEQVGRDIEDYFQGECSFDFIYAVPEQDAADIERCLDFIGRYRPEHVSYYELGIEEGTLFARWCEIGRLQPVFPERSEAQFYQILEGLEKLGYHRYEVSNFALPKTDRKTNRKAAKATEGAEGDMPLYHSHHNSAYWRWQPYLGLGPSAVGAAILHSQSDASHADARVWRSQGVRNWHTYMIEPDFGVNNITLSPQESFWEYLLMTLRLRKGVDLAEFCMLFYKLSPDQLTPDDAQQKMQNMLHQNFPKTMAEFADCFHWKKEGKRIFLQLDERSFDLQDTLLRLAHSEL